MTNEEPEFPLAEVLLAVGQIEEATGTKLCPDHPALVPVDGGGWVNPELPPGEWEMLLSTMDQLNRDECEVHDTMSLVDGVWICEECINESGEES